MIGIRISSAIRHDFLKALFAQSVHVLDSMPPGYATTTITTTSNTLQLGISEKLGVFVEFSATMIAAVVVAFTYSWELTLVTSSAILFILVTVSLLLPFIVKGQGRQSKVWSTVITRFPWQSFTDISSSQTQRLHPLPVKLWRAFE